MLRPEGTFAGRVLLGGDSIHFTVGDMSADDILALGPDVHAKRNPGHRINRESHKSRKIRDYSTFMK